MSPSGGAQGAPYWLDKLNVLQDPFQGIFGEGIQIFDNLFPEVHSRYFHRAVQD
jgi:hypothetical protein